MTAMIGIDPHKTTHMAVAIDGDEQAIARLEVRADRAQTQRLLAWAAPLGAERTWAIESAGGLGKLLSQELVAAGEHVVDVPPTLAARVRLMGSQKAAKNDGNDALSTAIAGLRHCGLRVVRGDGHSSVFRLLAGRYDDLIGLRTQAACRLHAVLRELVAGGAPRPVGRQSAGCAARDDCRPTGRRNCSVVSVPRVWLRVNASAWPPISWPMCAASIVSSPRSRPASETRSTRQAPPWSSFTGSGRSSLD